MYAVLPDVGEHVLKTKAGQDFSVLGLSVELPGIEPAAEIQLTSRNAEVDGAKSTRNDLRIRERC
jgi:hypothetical protein